MCSDRPDPLSHSHNDLGAIMHGANSHEVDRYTTALRANQFAIGSSMPRRISYLLLVFPPMGYSLLRDRFFFFSLSFFEIKILLLSSLQFFTIAVPYQSGNNIPSSYRTNQEVTTSHGVCGQKAADWAATFCEHQNKSSKRTFTWP